MKIFNNDLFKSRNEGIFIIKGKGSLIVRNKYFENNNGIYLFEINNIEIIENDIYLNIRNIYLISNNSETKIY